VLRVRSLVGGPLKPVTSRRRRGKIARLDRLTPLSPPRSRRRATERGRRTRRPRPSPASRRLVDRVRVA